MSRCIVSIIGASELEKSCLLRSINRLNELDSRIHTLGTICFRGQDIQTIELPELRRKIGMIFRSATPFPNMDIYNNVLAGYKLNAISLSQTEKNRIVEENLRKVELWEELKDCLHKKALFLTRGQQQRLCIARTIALNPEMLLMDELTYMLDPLSKNTIENLLFRLKNQYAIIFTTDNLAQAARVSDYTLFIDKGELIEYEKSSQLFVNPKDKRTEKYLMR
jgi:phosphate transport system ATP-binding protein